jgi:hypothetical protein
MKQLLKIIDFSLRTLRKPLRSLRLNLSLIEKVPKVLKFLLLIRIYNLLQNLLACFAYLAGKTFSELLSTFCRLCCQKRQNFLQCEANKHFDSSTFCSSAVLKTARL